MNIGKRVRLLALAMYSWVPGYTTLRQRGGRITVTPVRQSVPCQAHPQMKVFPNGTKSVKHCDNTDFNFH
jgi:hypothetical protein